MVSQPSQKDTATSASPHGTPATGEASRTARVAIPPLAPALTVPMRAGGVSVGETDELGAAAVKDRFHVKNLHATILSLMGIDPMSIKFIRTAHEREPKNDALLAVAGDDIVLDQVVAIALAEGDAEEEGDGEVDQEREGSDHPRIVRASVRTRSTAPRSLRPGRSSGR